MTAAAFKITTDQWSKPVEASHEPPLSYRDCGNRLDGAVCCDMGRARRRRARRAHVSRLRRLSFARAQSQHDRPKPCGNLATAGRIAAELPALLSRVEIVRHRLERRHARRMA